MPLVQADGIVVEVGTGSGVAVGAGATVGDWASGSAGLAVHAANKIDMKTTTTEISSGVNALARERHIEAPDCRDDFVCSADGLIRHLRSVRSQTPSVPPRSSRALLPGASGALGFDWFLRQLLLCEWVSTRTRFVSWQTPV